MLDDAPYQFAAGGGLFADCGSDAEPGTTASAASQTPSSTAAAARHTMPAELAPPRSTRSPKSSARPRYSHNVAGANIADSATPWVSRPLTHAGSTPASSMTIFASSAYWSTVNSGGLVGGRPAG